MEIDTESTQGNTVTGSNGRNESFSLAALLITVALFCVIDGTLVALFSLKEQTVVAGVGMFVLAGGPLGLWYGRRMYRGVRRWFQL